MREPSIDPERVAALLDGRLNEREREALLAELAQSDEEVDALADAAAVLRELEEEPADVPVPSPDVPNVTAHTRPNVPRHTDTVGLPVAPYVPHIRPRAHPSFVRQWGLVAAAAVALVAVTLWSRVRTPAPTPTDPVSLVASLSTPRGAPTRGALSPIPWDVTRGAGPTLSEHALSTRLGAITAQLALAAQARDSAAIPPLAREASTLLGDVSAGGPAAQLFASLGEASSEPFDVRLRSAWAGTVPLLDGDYAQMGAWLATARAAIARRDATYFHASSGQVARRAMLARTAADPEARAIAGRVDAQAGAQAIPWDTLGPDVELLLTRLGR